MTCTSWLVARMDSGSERNVPSASSVAATINNREWLTIFFMDPLSLAENKFSICGSKFCSRTSTHNNSGLILRLQKLDRDGQADYRNIAPPEQRANRSQSSQSIPVSWHLSHLARVRARQGAFAVMLRFFRFCGVLRPLSPPDASAHPRSRCSCLSTGRGRGHPQQS